jgi:polar amino acid transport system substrate-binding protein
MGIIKFLTFAAPLLWWTSAYAGPALKIVVDSSTAMPMALIADSKVTGGIHRDVGIAFAKALHADPAFIVMPRKRIPAALEKGTGHLACHFLPEWLPGAFDWSEPFMPNALLLLSSARVPRAGSLSELRGVPIGTVLGFEYPDVDHALDLGFIRDDAADGTRNLMKLDARRLNHALTGEVFLRYQQRRQGLAVNVQEPLLVRRYLASCAVSRTSPNKVGEKKRALNSHRESKEHDAI